MGLLEDQVLSICQNYAFESFGEQSIFEHVHTTFYTESAYGLIEKEGDTALLYFEFEDDTIKSCTTIHTFSNPISTAKLLCDKLIQVGREFGHKEMF